MLGGQDLQEADLEVRLHDFDALTSPLAANPPDITAVRAYFESRFGIVNRELLISYFQSGKALVFSHESRISDRLIEAMIATAKEACDRQLTGKRPGVLCLKFEGITAEELTLIGNETGAATPLRIATSKLLDSRQDSHIVCIGYFADGSLASDADGGVAREGRTYFFENRTSPYYSDFILPAFRDI